MWTSAWGVRMTDDRLQLVATIERLRRELDRANKSVHEMAGMHDVVRDVIHRALQNVEPPAMPPMPKASRKKQREIALVHLSDWQIGALTPEYDLTVAREMILGRLLDVVTKLTRERQQVASVDECVVLLGGDMVDGSALRGTHAWDVESNVYQQAMHDCPRMMADFVLALSSLFRKVRVECVRGNHGRPASFRANMNPAEVNWDSVAYETAKHMIKPDETKGRISWHNETATFFRLIDMGKQTVLAIHGDQARGSGGFAGVPYYALARLVARWSDSMPKDFDVMMLGHFHNPGLMTFGSKTIYVNGTTEIGSEWVLETLAMATRPAQRMQFWDPEHGVKSDHIIWLQT